MIPSLLIRSPMYFQSSDDNDEKINLKSKKRVENNISKSRGKGLIHCLSKYHSIFKKRMRKLATVHIDYFEKILQKLINRRVNYLIELLDFTQKGLSQISSSKKIIDLSCISFILNQKEEISWFKVDGSTCLNALDTVYHNYNS